MKLTKKILLLAILFLPLKAGAADIDMQEYLFGHVGDSYGWHITTIKGHPVSVNLPVIVRSKTSGWHCFSSRHISEGETYEGFRIAVKGEAHEGKLVEVMPSGELVKPLDISITKNVAGLMFNSLLVVLIILLAARWYRRHDATQEAPKGFAGVVEMLVTMVEDDIIKECVGKDYKRYSPYLLTAFFFIFVNNLMGLIPIFPGGANVTGNIAITGILAVITFFITSFSADKNYWKHLINTPGVPWFLKFPIPLMPVVEIIGIFTKPFVLMVRLFANITAGHIIALGVVALIFIFGGMAPALGYGVSIVSLVFYVFMGLLEVIVAFIQAFVFTLLTALFTGMAMGEDHAEA